MIYQQQYDIPVKIVRPFNVFGPGMKHDDRRVVSMFTYQALNGKTVPVHGDGHQTRTFCYITDAMIGFLKVLLNGKPGEAYNIGNDNNEISMRDLARIFVDLMDQRASYELIDYPDTYPAGEPQRRCPDLTKARDDIGFVPQVSFREGLERFMAWCRTQESYVGDPTSLKLRGARQAVAARKT